ncbi:MAG: hypothetical protein PHS14_10730 [Elusimicrobia bacterium]|nr:hypothetical protein [Elusimicrobiota bacterium]
MVVEAEGWTPLDAKKPLETKQRALAEAQKKAVEKALGVTVSATTKVESAITLEQSILANIGGYIRRYDILSEREEDGFLKTRIRAFVLYQPPKPLPEAASRVRIAVLCVDERLARAARAALTSQGFTLKDNAAEADYVVTGNVSVYSLADSTYAGLHAGRARVSLDATQTKTRTTFQNIQEASGLDLSDEIAHDKAVDNAAAMAGEALAAHLKATLGIPGDASVSDKP